MSAVSACRGALLVSCLLVASACGPPSRPGTDGNGSDWGRPDAGAPAFDGGAPPGDAAPASGCPVWDGGLSNQCTAGCMPLKDDVFNPGDVYLIGSLNRDAPVPNDYYAIAHWSDPNNACVGFDPNYNGASAAIGPTDGRFYYMNLGDTILRQFRKESCGTPTVASYPAYPLANDQVVPTKQCGTSGILDFKLSPEGGLYYVCAGGDGSWVSDQTGKSVFNNPMERLRVIGQNQIALIEYGTYNGIFYGGDFKVGNFTTGNEIDVVWAGGKPTINPDAKRANAAGGFWIGWKTDGGGAAELWEVAPDGNAKKIGVYPSPPAIGDLLGANSTLDGCQGLLQWGHDLQDNSIIVRRDLMGGSVVGYSRTESPLVQVGPSSTAQMITAP